MSAIAALYNVPVTEEELAVWATAHARHHIDINRVLYEQTGENLVDFILDPIDPNDTGVWSDQHQIMHFNMDQILGIQGYDLTLVDFKNQELMTGWVQLNADEHYIAANALGIG